MNFYKFENEYYDKGYKYVCGIDEVGRGCLFGDVVSCAIIMPKVNIKMATHISMINALENLRNKKGEKVIADCVLIDAETIETGIFQHAIIKGDESCYSIACASIIAKVYRDDLCNKWGKDYPHYGIEKHKGYGTKYHRDALKDYGPTMMHRKTFLKNMKLW